MDSKTRAAYLAVKAKTGGKAVKKCTVSDNLFALFLLLPAALTLIMVVGMPILKGIWVSFCDYTIANLDAPVWNNFANYRAVFKNGKILTYFSTTLIYVGLAVGIQFILGLALALLLNTNVKGRGLFRGLFLIPWTIPSVVVAILFRWMFHQQFGVMNYLLHLFGLTDTVNIAWTQQPFLAMLLVVMAAVWRQLPYMMVMILAALQSVDKTLIEAARIDGAGAGRILWNITLPSIKPVASTAVWLAVLSNFQMFTIVYNMTGGGPVDATTTLGIAAYRTAFQAYNFGEGSTIGVLWMLVLLAGTLAYNYLNERSINN